MRIKKIEKKKSTILNTIAYNSIINQLTKLNISLYYYIQLNLNFFYLFKAFFFFF